MLSISILSYGVTGPAFADNHNIPPISVSVDADVYANGNVVTITGTLRDFDSSLHAGHGLTLIVTSPDGKNRVYVGQLEPNGFGFYDIRGNVWEWAHDGYWLYPEEATVNPVGDPSDRHSVRGGRWGNEPYALRSSKRILPKADFWDGNFGFRLAIRASNNFR